MFSNDPLKKKLHQTFIGAVCQGCTELIGDHCNLKVNYNFTFVVVVQLVTAIASTL